jgi:hypothetical protein
MGRYWNMSHLLISTATWVRVTLLVLKKKDTCASCVLGTVCWIVRIEKNWLINGLLLTYLHWLFVTVSTLKVSNNILKSNAKIIILILVVAFLPHDVQYYSGIGYWHFLYCTCYDTLFLIFLVVMKFLPHQKWWLLGYYWFTRTLWGLHQ